MQARPPFLTLCLGAALLLAAPLSPPAQAAPPAAQSSVANGVSVKVTPRPPAARSGRWEFAITLDTHSAELSDDLAQSATLTTGDGRSFKPVSWSGAPPGGHHRSGVLAFDIPAPPPATLELRLARPGESAPRSFRWQF